MCIQFLITWEWKSNALAHKSLEIERGIFVALHYVRTIWLITLNNEHCHQEHLIRPAFAIDFLFSCFLSERVVWWVVVIRWAQAANTVVWEWERLKWRSISFHCIYLYSYIMYSYIFVCVCTQYTCTNTRIVG